MSAFLCSPEHLNAILHYYRKDPSSGSCLNLYPISGKTITVGDWISDETWRQAYKTLYDENVRSLKTRYPKDTYDECNLDEYYFPFFEPRISAVACLKSCECYTYQASETKDYDASEAAALIRAIKATAINELPGYDKAPWGETSTRFSRVSEVTAPKLVSLSALSKKLKPAK